jgi:hypothetical protein
MRNHSYQKIKYPVLIYNLGSQILRKSNNRLETHWLFHESWWFFADLENNWNQWLVFFDSDFSNTFD